jgi:hypothetical protein
MIDSSHFCQCSQQVYSLYVDVCEPVHIRQIYVSPPPLSDTCGNANSPIWQDNQQKNPEIET